MTASTSLFNLIDQNFAEDSIECCRFSDDVSFSRAIYREDFRAILIDATCLSAPCAALARRACYADRRAPLIVVGAFNDRLSIERAFAAGADDVVLAPFTSSELAARTYQALRRFSKAPTEQAEDFVQFGAYKLERRAAVVAVDGKLMRLTSREFAIAWTLFSQAGEYVSRRQIAGAVWSSTEDIVGRTLEQHIYKLRKKLQLNGTFGVHLRTMYAHGYRVELADAVEDSAPAALAVEIPDSKPPELPTPVREMDRAVLRAFEDPQAPDTAYGSLSTYDSPGAASLESPRDAPLKLEVHTTYSEAALSARPWAPEAECRLAGSFYSTRITGSYAGIGSFAAGAGSWAAPPQMPSGASRQDDNHQDTEPGAEAAHPARRQPVCSRR
ncbi:DNA-binding response regulator, OmpR family, contains REC and winged-helix (wHTH) domain [Burkholderia sp. D7]|nr:DNA-binding response regulator, OmpR family, contains REC and winged-helix (wHTH) domain [Burkholderia sp. D7]